jgi:hypothetical protein
LESESKHELFKTKYSHLKFINESKNEINLGYNLGGKDSAAPGAAPGAVSS